MIVLFNISDSSGIRWQGDGIWRIAGRRRIYTFTRHDGRSERRAPLHHLDIKGKNKIQPLLSHCDRHGTFVLVHWPSNWIGFFFAVPFVFFFFSLECSNPSRRAIQSPLFPRCILHAQIFLLRNCLCPGLCKRIGRELSVCPFWFFSFSFDLQISSAIVSCLIHLRFRIG